MSVEDVRQIAEKLKNAIIKRKELIMELIDSINGIAEEKWEYGYGNRSSPPDRSWNKGITLESFRFSIRNDYHSDHQGLLFYIVFRSETVLTVFYQNGDLKVLDFNDDPSWVLAVQDVLNRSEQIIAMKEAHEELRDLRKEAEKLGINTNRFPYEWLDWKEKP
jgi:hypothetical protein